VAAPARNARGTFQTELPRDERTVFEIIRQLVVLAAERYDKDPTQVTLAEADSCSNQLVGFGRIGRIHGLLAQIPDRHGKPYPYRKLLRDLFDENRSFEHVRREQVTVDDWPDLDEGHIDYGLNRIADFAGLTSLPPSTYDVYREDLIRDLRRRRQPADELAARIPTSDQIIRVYLRKGDGSEKPSPEEASPEETPVEHASPESRVEAWNRALTEHGLDPQPVESYQQRAVRVPEAIKRFYEKTGFLPSKKQLSKFAKYFQFSVQDWKGPWAEGLDAGREAIKAAGLDDPPPYRPRQDKPVWEDEIGSRAWDPSDASYRPKLVWDTEAKVLEAVGEFVRNEVGPGRPASQDRYQDWSAKSPDRPSIAVLQNYGGLPKLARKLSRQGELAKAKREAERLANPTQEEREAREQEKLAAIVAKEQCQQILKLVTERGEIGAREIEAALGWGKSTASNWLPYLRRAGLVVCTTESPVAKNARYRLPGEITPEQQAAADRQRKVELLQHPNGQATWELLKERGEITSPEVAAECGFTRDTAKEWLNKLVELGYAEREQEWLGRGGRRSSIDAVITALLSEQDTKERAVDFLELVAVEVKAAAEHLADEVAVGDCRIVASGFR
jgi:predicted transcriptional regulator